MKIKSIHPEKLKVLDPCVGSGHFLAYAIDILWEIYCECNWSDHDATKSITTELAGIEDVMRQIFVEFHKGMEAYLAETQKLTSEIMQKITSNLRKQMNNPNKFRGITPEMMADNIIDCLKDTEMTEEQKASLKAD